MAVIRDDTLIFIISALLALISFVAILSAAVVNHWKNTHTKPEKDGKKVYLILLLPFSAN
jgi:hypothetical protein